MNIILIFAGVAIVAGIVYLVAEFFHKHDSRAGYLEKLAEYLEAKVELISSMDNSHRIRFTYEGKYFIFEDVEDVAIQTKIFKGYLRTTINYPFSLRFTEKPRSTVKMQIGGASAAAASAWQDTKAVVQLPKDLSEFVVTTNNARIANLLLSDANTLAIFKRLKNVDQYGHPIMSLEILEGTLTLKFHPEGQLKPNLLDLHHNVTRIDKYLDQMIAVFNKAQELRTEWT